MRIYSDCYGDDFNMSRVMSGLGDRMVANEETAIECVDVYNKGVIILLWRNGRGNDGL